MAKVLLENMIPGHLKDKICVDSAGVSAIEGNSATDEAIQVMAERGMDLSPHQAKFLGYEQMKQSNLILVMEKNHLHHVGLFYRPEKDKAHLLREFDTRKKAVDVPDPYGKPLKTYKSCADLIESCMAGVIDYIEKDLNGRTG